jgi:hypothetical protein
VNTRLQGEAIGYDQVLAEYNDLLLELTVLE